MFLRIMRIWLPLAIVATGAIGFAYVAAQQVYRMSANDPQVQLAQDGASQIGTTGYSAIGTRTVGSDEVDLATMDAPWVDYYAETGDPVVIQGRIDHQIVVVPKGVLDTARAKGEDRVTWQPKPGVRQAIVAVKVTGEQGGFVVAGRSLRETEKRIDDLSRLALAALAAVLVVSLLLVAAFEWRVHRLREESRLEP